MFIPSKDLINLGSGLLGKMSNLEELVPAGDRQSPFFPFKARMW